MQCFEEHFWLEWTGVNYQCCIIQQTKPFSILRSTSSLTQKDNNEKRRGKNALIVHNDSAEISDNVEYEE